MDCGDYRDLVAAHVDDCLTRVELSAAMSHVSGCAACARLLEAQRALKLVLRARALVQPTPAPARRTVMERIAEDESARPAPGMWRDWWSRAALRWALAAAVGLLLMAIALPLLRQRPETASSALFNTIVTDYRAVDAGRSALGKHTDDPMELRVYYYGTGAFRFTNTVVDLEPLGFVLQGGQLTELAGKPSTLNVYRGTRGLVVCHRIEAEGVELPPGGEVIGGDRFYTVDGITILVHREGSILCFMSSAMPRAEMVRLLTGRV
jgi:hypothetical protein